MAVTVTFPSHLLAAVPNCDRASIHWTTFIWNGSKYFTAGHTVHFTVDDKGLMPLCWQLHRDLSDDPCPCELFDHPRLREC